MRPGRPPSAGGTSAIGTRIGTQPGGTARHWMESEGRGVAKIAN